MRALALILVVAAAVACSPAVTRRSFVEQANAQCASINQRFETLPPAGGGGTAETLRLSLTASESGLQALRTVRAPAEVAADYGRMLRAIERANDHLRRAIAAAERKDDEALAAAATAIGAQQDEFRSLAGRLGLLSCVTAGAEP